MITETLIKRPAKVKFGFESVPGLMTLGMGIAEVEMDRRGDRQLKFVVDGVVADSINLDGFSTVAPGPVEALQTLSYMDYEARIHSSKNSIIVQKNLSEEYFVKPLVAFSDSSRVYVYKVDARGQLTYAFETPAFRNIQVSIFKAQLKDRRRILNSAADDLVLIESDQGRVLYSPVLKGVVNPDQLVVEAQAPEKPSMLHRFKTSVASCMDSLVGNFIKLPSLDTED